MSKNLGDLGVYDIKQHGQLFLAKPGRKFSRKKDPNTVPPRQFISEDLNPSHSRVGDIVDFGSYRKTQSYIVALDHNKKLFLLRLPDQGHSGYATIPLEISSFFKNAIDAYENFSDIEYIHLSPKDQGLKKYFFKGKTVPRKYTYRYHVSSDTVEVHDPTTKKTLDIDRSGDKIGRFMTYFFKPHKTIEKQIVVRQKINPVRKRQLEKQEDQEKYKQLRKIYSKERTEFREAKKHAMKNILLKNNITQMANGGSGGSYQSNNKYILQGTEKNISKALKELKKLSEHGQKGIFEIQEYSRPSYV